MNKEENRRRKIEKETKMGREKLRK